MARYCFFIRRQIRTTETDKTGAIIMRRPIHRGDYLFFAFTENG